jgi:hypothetical protein
VLGAINDFWYRWVTDIGITGPDKGQGGKYLILPPGCQGAIPAGYAVVRPKTYGNSMPFRSFLVDGSPKPGVESVWKHLKIYQLSDSANPPAITFANASGVPANFVAPGDDSFWTLLNQVIQEEPPEGADPTTLGLFASIGIVTGKPFQPDAHEQDSQRCRQDRGGDGANPGLQDSRTRGLFYPNSSWRLPFFVGYRFEVFPGLDNLDGAIFDYYVATVVTPAMEE